MSEVDKTPPQPTSNPRTLEDAVRSSAFWKDEVIAANAHIRQLRELLGQAKKNCSCPYGDCTTCSKIDEALSGEYPCAHETGCDEPVPHGVIYDRLGWVCSVCGGWNHARDKGCTHTHPGLHPDSPYAQKAKPEPIGASAAGKALYIANTANDPSIHCNRFPAWEELDQAQRDEWTRRAQNGSEQS